MTNERMRVGIVLPIAEDDEAGIGVPDYPEIRAVAVAAEAAGLDSLWVFDHLLYRFDGVEAGIHECWTILAAIAEATSRVELGTIVMATPFRNPALLAKMAATLDNVSGGRLILGVGTGWHEPEFEAFGFPFDHRAGRFEESLAVIVALIREGRADLDGRWITVRDVVLRPPARPDLPILIAAKGPRMMDLTARHADSWNAAWFGMPDERLAERRADLAAACERVGRDPATLGITVGLTVRYPDLAAPPEPPTTPGLTGSAEDIAAGLRAHADLGAAHAITVLEPSTPAAVERFAEAVELYRAG
jgi:probable F420-dependent oxidoreductase